MILRQKYQGMIAMKSKFIATIKLIDLVEASIVE